MRADNGHRKEFVRYRTARRQVFFEGACAKSTLRTSPAARRRFMQRRGDLWRRE